MKVVSMEGVIDMHVHSNPDLRPRAIVIKTHHGATMDRAYLCSRYNQLIHGGANDFTMYGSITLNHAVGGINPKDVEVALELGATPANFIPLFAVRHPA